MSEFLTSRRYPLSVFTGYGPGLKLEHLGLITPGTITGIDYHVDIDPAKAKQELEALPGVLDKYDLKLDGIVFGLPGEEWEAPSIARQHVGFAAPGNERRSKRFVYAETLAKEVAQLLKPEHFIRGRLTMKGHFGAFDPTQANRYHNLQVCLRQLRLQVKEHGLLFLAETGCESAEAVIALIESIGRDTFAANWDTANLRLWNSGHENIAYGQALAAAGVLQGVHIKGGQASEQEDKWGTEVEPVEVEIVQVLQVLDTAADFNGPITVEREMFLGEQRETQEQKADGLNRTLEILLKHQVK